MILGICIVSFWLTACSHFPIQKVVLTKSFAKNEVFRIEDISCTLPEMMVYITTMQNQYENVYGTQIWDIATPGESLSENVKNNALAKMAQVKTMNLMARQFDVTLDEEELALVHQIAANYYQSLNQAEIQGMQVSETLIQQMYEEYALAEKVYNYIIRDINPEVSDDEARTITVQYILIKTYAEDGTGKKIEYTYNAKKDARELAQKVYEEAISGVNFDELIRKYSDDTTGTISFGKGDLEESIEEVAFNLGNEEISQITETSQGFYIIKCINTFNKGETDANKIKIVEEKREQVFGNQYDTFVEQLTRRLNERLWNEIEFLSDEQIVTDNFFQIFDENY